jgi:anti-sigma B factor antagonist
MRFTEERQGDVIVVGFEDSRLTSHEAPEIKTALLGWMAKDAPKLLVNLKAVENMDSTGLGSLLFGIRQAERLGKDIRFCEIGSKVQFLIRIAHLDDVMDVYATQAEALKDWETE